MILRTRAFTAITAGAQLPRHPWQMGVVAKLLRMLPNALFDRLSGRARPRKQQRVVDREPCALETTRQTTKKAFAPSTKAFSVWHKAV